MLCHSALFKTQNLDFENARFNLKPLGSSWFVPAIRARWRRSPPSWHLPAAKNNSLFAKLAMLPTWTCLAAPHDYPLVNKHRPRKSPILNGNSSSNPYLPGSMLTYQRVHFLEKQWKQWQKMIPASLLLLVKGSFCTREFLHKSTAGKVGKRRLHGNSNALHHLTCFSSHLRRYIDPLRTRIISSVEGKQAKHQPPLPILDTLPRKWILRFLAGYSRFSMTSLYMHRKKRLKMVQSTHPVGWPSWP